MSKKKSKEQQYLESKALYKHGGVIDLKKLWAKDAEVELEPKIVDKIIDEYSETWKALA